VNIVDFKINASQKQAIRRFHKYLNYGDVHGEKIEIIKTESDLLMEKVKEAIEITCEGKIKDAFMIHKVFFNAKFGAICSNALNYVDAEKLKEF
jgi:hypothetical protein